MALTKDKRTNCYVSNTSMCLETYFERGANSKRHTENKIFGNCQTGCLQYSMTNSDSTAKTFNCLLRVGETTSSRIAAALFILAKYLRFPTAGWRLCLWASICLRVSFYALINFRLAEVPHQLLCGCAAASADFLFAYLPRLNQHTHTHKHTKYTTVHTHSHKGLNHPTLSCLAFTRIQRAAPFRSCLPWLLRQLQPTHCMFDFFCCHLTRGKPHLSTQWANPPASPCRLTPISRICLVAVLRLFIFICWYNLVTLFAYNLRLVVARLLLLLVLLHRVRPLLALET